VGAFFGGNKPAQSRAGTGIEPYVFIVRAWWVIICNPLPSLLITGQRWLEWKPEKQLQILPLRVRMTAVVAKPAASESLKDTFHR
jgi:hypothetical protein